MDGEAVTTATKKHPGISRRAALTGYMVLLVFVFFGIYRTEQNGRDADSAIHRSQVEACERGNDVRAALVEGLKDDIRSTRRTKPSFFPNIPPAEFQALIAAQIQRKEALIKTLAPVDCAKAYPQP